MSNPFFDHPILSSPYQCPSRHWELDQAGQPTQKILEIRRRAEFITPIPKPKKRKKAATQEAFVFDDGKGLSTSVVINVRKGPQTPVSGTPGTGGSVTPTPFTGAPPAPPPPTQVPTPVPTPKP